MECKCGNCPKALKFLGGLTGADGVDLSNLCTARTGDVGHALSVARKRVSAMNGSTMYMTLPSGTNIVRFLLPTVALAPSGTAGKYSEGDNINVGIALATALAGLLVV